MPKRNSQHDLGFEIVADIGYLKFQEIGKHQNNFTQTPHPEHKTKKKRKKEMSQTVSTDLLVTTAPCRVEEKMNVKRNALLESLRKGEPKIFGVSQIALGFLIISYSLPLLMTESSLIINIGVPWWSGLMFVFSGATAIAVEKNARCRTLTVCLTVSIVAVIVSLIALALYYIDIRFQLSSNFSSDLKNIISILIMAQTAVSSAFTAILYKVKNNIYGYEGMNE